ncbi:MAG: hypothetical protein ACRCUT_09870, partial [Spirochaetota bacterium]
MKKDETFSGYDLLSHDLLIGQDSALLQKMLYQTDARPDMVIVQYQDAAQCADLMESMLFGPCRTALFVKGNIPYSDRASVMSLKGSASGVNAGRSDHFAAGQDILVSDDSSLKAAAAANAKKTAAVMLSAGDAKEAYRQFRKYAGASSDDMYTLSGIHDLSGDTTAAAEYAFRSIEGSSSPEHLSWAVYCALKNGECSRVQALLDSPAFSALGSSPDAVLYRQICDAAAAGRSAAFNVPAAGSLLNRELLSLLSLRYSLLMDLPRPSVPRVIAAFSPADSAVVSFAEGGSDAGLGLTGADSLIRMKVSAQKALEEGRIQDYISQSVLFEEASSSVPYPALASRVDKARFLTASRRYDDAKDLLAQVKNAAENPFLKNEYSLLSAECAIFTGDIQEGKAYLSSSSFESGRDCIVRDLLLAHAERVSVLSDPSYAAKGLAEYEKHMKSAISRVTPQMFSGKRPVRSDLFDSGIDFLISYSMKKGDHASALLFTDIKRQSNLWRSFPVSSDLSAEAADAWDSAEKSSSQSLYAESLSRYPELIAARRILSLDISRLQKKIPAGSCVVCIVRNEHDLLAWIIDREHLQPVRIAGGYDKAADIVSRYNSAAEKLEPVSRISSDCASLLSPVLKYTADKKLYIVPDQYTEAI